MTILGALRYVILAVVAGGFLYYCLVVATRARRWAVVVAVLLTLGLTTTVVTTIVARVAGTVPHPLWLIVTTSGVAVVLYTCLALTVVCLTNLIWWLITTRRGRSGQDSSVEDGLDHLGRITSLRVRIVRVLTVAAIVFGLVMTSVGYVRARSITLTPISVAFADLPPAFDQMTIALVSDLHVGATTRADFLPRVVDQINAAHPDLIVIDGDVVDGPVAKVQPRLSALTRLSAPYGVVVTTGNHEFYSDPAGWIRAFEELGLTVLDNDGFAIQRGEEKIEVLGVNDARGTDDLAPDLELACRRAHGATCTADDSVWRLLAAHEPKQVFDQDGLAKTIGVELQLSGHTHGGQLWPLNWFVRWDQPTVDGVEVVDSVTIVTSRGVGTWGPPIRVGADPQIPVITLRRPA
ncbi:MAG: metallophosphoesterase [Propionibacteriaceae bacterium]|jgi:predicted MPP superfamily phosphohydrolase|nr:metallophosphoesterase [Propionibacteriaceae bacterium]